MIRNTSKVCPKDHPLKSRECLRVLHVLRVAAYASDACACAGSAGSAQSGQQTGINAEVVGLCVHSMRTTAATNALSNEVDIAKLQDWLSHATFPQPGSTTGVPASLRIARHLT